ncbi:MAG: hypothetical protein WAT09_14620 [Paracoccaceae bacterium]
MTDRVALYLALFLVAMIGLDFLITGGSTLIFLARKFLIMVHWMEFWH